MGPGVIWIAALLASMLSLSNLFKADFDDGTLEQCLLSPAPSALLISTKIIAHWLSSGLPMIIFSPLLGVFMYLPESAMLALIQTLLLGTPVLSLVGAIGSALTVGLKQGGILLSLLILPLYIPLLIFATSAINNSMAGLTYTGQLYMMAALLVLSLTLAPFAIVAALRISLE